MRPEQAEQLRLGVERALAARDAYHAAADEAAGASLASRADPGWYVPADVPELSNDRPWVENGGAVWTSDTPPMLSALIDTFSQSGVIDHIEQFMGERPGLSVGKSTLRRVPITSGTDWHQDGAFLGRDVRSVNVWLALSDCGVDASGLDVVAQRLPYVVQTGSHGAYFDWSVGQGMVDVLAEGGAPVVSPAFKAGDALLVRPPAAAPHGYHAGDDEIPLGGGELVLRAEFLPYAAGAVVGLTIGSKAFFFEKKKQKAFICAVAGC